MINEKEVPIFESTSLDTTVNYLTKERDRVTLLDMSDLIGEEKDKLYFEDDKYLVAKYGKLAFNTEGFSRLGNIINIPVGYIRKLRTAGLSSQVISDTLLDKDKRKALKRYNAVYDNVEECVIGFVSKDDYIPFSNMAAFEELNIEKLLGDSFVFHSATVINTKLYLRLISNKIECINESFPDKSVSDITKIGIVVRNSMTADSALSLETYYYRLLCSNGLIAEGGKIKTNIRHSGSQERFDSKVSDLLKQKIKRLPQAKQYIEKLMQIPYIPEKFHKAGGFKKLELNGFVSLPEKEYKTLENYIAAMEALITKLGWSRRVFHSSFRCQVTMFDLVNVLTEKAGGANIQRKAEMQESAGKIADWILDNARKFK